MKHILFTTIAAVLLVGCETTQQSVSPVAAKPVEPVAEAVEPEPPTGKAPNISIQDAAAEGNIEAVKQHLASGADVTAKDSSGWTPLHKAASSGHKEIAELLITLGADLNAKDDTLEFTPLHYATMGAGDGGHKEIVELLINRGADVNAKASVGGLTPLLIAAMEGHYEVVELLTANGADMNAKDTSGKTPLVWAIRLKRTELADLLRKHGGKTGEELKAEGK